MKQRLFPEVLSGFFYAFCITAGAVFCPITAFSIQVEPAALLAAIALFSLAFSLCFTVRYGWIGVIGTFVLLAAFLISRRMEVLGGFCLCAEAVVQVFSEAFSWGLVFVLPEGMAYAMSANAFFLLPAAFIACLCALSIVRLHGCALCFAASLPPLVFCLIILETAPAIWALVLLLGALSLALLTQSLRRAEPSAGWRAGLLLAVPLAALLTALCLLSPPERYERGEWSSRLQSTLAHFADSLSFFRLDERTGQVEFVSPFTPSTLGSRSWDSSVTSADLSRIGPQKQTGRHVMDVCASATGVCHLRAASLGIYEDNAWKAVPESAFSDVSVPKSAFLNVQTDPAQIHSLAIRTDMKSSLYYLPYRPVELPENAQTQTDAYVCNRLQSTEYTVHYATSASATEQSERYRALVYAQYTQLPDAVRATLAELPAVQSLTTQSYDAHSCAEAVRMLVQTDKSYSLNTARMPSGEDFVCWFLTQSETGYCVHFASAAAVLLRWCGIPARYVTGYYVSAKQGQWTAVTEDDAHAWVEYYDGTQWCVLDPTPASFHETMPQTEENVLSASRIEGNPPEISENPNDSLPDKPETTPEPSAKPSQDPFENRPHNTDDAELKGEGRDWLFWTLGVLAFVGVWFLYRAIRLSGRKTQLSTGSTNRRAVLYYRHIRLLAHLTDMSIPEAAEAAALKAKYSRHRLSEEELLVLTDCAEAIMWQIMQEKRLWKRFLYRMIYALY